MYVNTVLSHTLHIIRFLQQPSEKDEAQFISLKLLMKSPRFREVKQGVVEAVSAGEKKKQQQKKNQHVKAPYRYQSDIDKRPLE